MYVFEYQVHKHEIITPPSYLKNNNISAREYRYEIKHTLAPSID
jgi:hypothetical protein